MLTRIGALLIGLLLILQPMSGIPAAQAAYSAQDTVPAGPTLPAELNQRPGERRYDDAQPFTGTLSQGPAPTSNAEVAVALASATQVAGGLFHTCALTAAGGVKCWGRNVSGQLGNGSTVDSLVPIDVTGLLSGVTGVYAGDLHTCAVLDAAHGGGVRCWGRNSAGQLGDGTTQNRTQPVSVQNLSSQIAAVAAGNSHTCALTSSGAMKCWGFNGYGQLGDNSTTNRLLPVAVAGLSGGVNAIAAGSSHSCAVTSVGQAKCWGYNIDGQLGDGTTTNRSVPVNVSGLSSGVTTLGAGDYHTCAVTTSGAAKCWGGNTSGQVGAPGSPKTPVDVSGLASGALTIDAGYVHTCARLDAAHGGGVVCWGDNQHGQLGDGSGENRASAGSVPGLTSGVRDMASGEDHVCAVLDADHGGGIKCWGDNRYGQLGNGKAAILVTPVEVSNLGGSVANVTAGWSTRV